MAKKNTTLLIDEDVKREFKAECTLTYVDMSAAVETFMKNYTETSKRLRNGKEERE